MLTMHPLEQSGEWGVKSKKEYILDKDGQHIKLKNGTFKSRKVDTVDWNSQEKAEVWRQAWADIANRYLDAQAKENPFPSVPIPSERPEQPLTLLELLNRAYTEAAKPHEPTVTSNWGKIQDLKLYAKAFNFLQSRNITTLVQLQEVVWDMKKQYWTTNGEIKQTEKLLHERKELIDQAEKYLEHRPTYKAYMQTRAKTQSKQRDMEL